MDIVLTLSIGTDKPEHSVDPDQMLQNAASDQGLQNIDSFWLKINSLLSLTVYAGLLSAS